jgi:hypothetical protein
MGSPRSRLVFVLAAAILLGPAPGVAGPPYLTDDPEPVAYGHWEVYLATQHSITRGLATGAAPLADINYGAWPGLQLHVMGQLTYARPGGNSTSYGVGDTEIGAKMRFVDGRDWLPMMSLYPLLDFPTGDAALQLGSGRLHGFVPLWMQKSFGPWTTFGGGGLWVNPGAGNRNYWYAGWQAQCRVSGFATVGTEVFYSTPSQTGAKANLGFNLGLVLDLSEYQHVLFSAGRSIAGDNLFQGYGAYQLTL